MNLLILSTIIVTLTLIGSALLAKIAYQHQKYSKRLSAQNRAYETIALLKWSLKCLKVGLPNFGLGSKEFEAYRKQREQAAKEIVSLEQEITEFESKWCPLWHKNLNLEELLQEAASLLESIEETLKFHSCLAGTLNEIFINDPILKKYKVTSHQTAQNCIQVAKDHIHIQ